MRLHDPKSGIPYGVALAVARLRFFRHTEVFRISAARQLLEDVTVKLFLKGSVFGSGHEWSQYP